MNEVMKIKSSFYIIGRYKYENGIKRARLCDESLEFCIGLQKETVTIQCSFKHIYQVKFFYERSHNEAGLIFYVNELCAKRIQREIEPDGNGFFDMKTQTPNTKWFIIMNVINFEEFKAVELKNASENFHKRYIIDIYMKRGNDPTTANDLNIPFTVFIDKSTWQQELKTADEKIGLNKNLTNGKPSIFYNIQNDGTICPIANYSNVESDGATMTYYYPRNQMPIETQNELNIQAVKRILVAPASPPQIRAVHIKESVTKSNNNLGNSIPLAFSRSGCNQNPFFGENAIALMTMHGVKRKRVNNTDICTIDDDEEEAGTSDKKPREFRHENKLVLRYPPSGKDFVPLNYNDLQCLDEQVMLNDTIIDFYLKYIINEMVPEERRKSMYMFNTFFYSKLNPPTNKPNVTQSTRLKRVEKAYQTLKSWTKNVNIFEKDYLIIPINEDIHWYLAIIVNPRAGIQDYSEKGQTFYVIIFDSLLEPERHKYIHEILGEYLRLEYLDKKETKKLPGSCFKRVLLKKILPRDLPQQKNEVDCGLFLLHYSEMFLTNPPAIIEPNASFNKWCPDFEIKQKRQAIQFIIIKLAKNAGVSIKFADFQFDSSSEETKKDLNRWIQAEKVKSKNLQRRASESNLLDIYSDSQHIILKHSKSHNDLSSLIAIQQATSLNPQ